MAENDITDFAYYSVSDYAGNSTLSGYALSICPFTFIPRLSNKAYLDRVLWDFGDGTTSTSLCASHSYSFPGNYTVTLYVYASGGEAYTSSFNQTLQIENYINDTISLSSKNAFIQPTSVPGHGDGISVIVHNSLPTLQTLSADQITINLYASGADNAFKTADEYYSDKSAHLRSNYLFYRNRYNSFLNSYDLEVIDSLSFEPGETLYACISNNAVTQCAQDVVGAIPVGSKTIEHIYFTSDLISPDRGKWLHEKDPVFGFLSFDTSKFEDGVSWKNDYYTNDSNRSRLPYLNTEPESFGVLSTPHLSVTELTFSLNGIDNEAFNIPETQYAKTRIPFVVRVQYGEYPVKYLPALSSVDSVVSPYEIQIVAVSGDGDIIPAAATPYFFESRSDNLSAGGGYWKGYMYFDNAYLTAGNTLSSIRLSAFSLIDETYTQIETMPTVAFFSDSSSENILRADMSVEYKTDYSETVTYSKPYNIHSYIVSGSEGAFAVIPDENIAIGSYFSYWSPAYTTTAKAIKVDSYGNSLSSIDLSGFGVSATTLTGSRIAADSEKSIWLTLTENSSAIKITSSGENTYSIVEAASTIGAIDTDSNDNIWVSFSDVSGSVSLNKYSATGTSLSSVSLTANYIPVDLCVTSTDDVWVICQTSLTGAGLSAYNDLILYHDTSAGDTTAVYSTSGRASFCTVDTDDNLFFINGLTEVCSISATDYTSTIIEIDSSNISTVSNLQGIATTANNNIIVIDDYQNEIATISPYTYAVEATTSVDNISGASLFAVGDWTGFRWANKYGTVTTTVSNALTGESNSFSVFADNQYKVEKNSEYFDATELYKDLRYQEALLDDNVMFEDFIGTIVGDLSSSPDTIGKRVHDKISDYVSNISDIDKCNIKALYSLYSMVDGEISDFENFRFSLPSNLSRLLDIFSINKSLLLPGRNQFARDFDTKRHTIRNNVYGINLGDRITDLETAILSASSPIVAKSKFSETYRYINTDVLSSYVTGYRESTKTYPLSAFTVDWGWPLVLEGDSSTYRDVGTLYELYNYTLTAADTQLEGVLNWDTSEYQNLNETLSGVEDWYGKNGIVSEALRYSLLEGTGLFADTLSG